MRFVTGSKDRKRLPVWKQREGIELSQPLGPPDWYEWYTIQQAIGELSVYPEYEVRAMLKDGRLPVEVRRKEGWLPGKAAEPMVHRDAIERVLKSAPLPEIEDSPRMTGWEEKCNGLRR